jgi:integrase
MNEATERGYNKKLDFRGRRFKRLHEQVYSIYLNEEELGKIWRLDLSEKPNLERVRDLFMIGCYTGLRYSDLIRIRSENIVKENGSSYLSILTQKTSQQVIIPLKPIVLEILSKYGGSIPKPLTNQKMNKYLKVIGRMADISQLIPVEKTKGGIRTKELVPKYELIRTHTCRKSFATNAFRSGLPTLAIMKITGHKTETQFYKYVRISELENAEQLNSHEFFKK